MTKRPETKEEFMSKYVELKEDKKEVAKFYNVNLTTIYNWIQVYQIGVEASFNSPKEISNEDYFDIHRKSIIKPREREASVSLPKTILIVCMSDMHLGSAFLNDKMLEEDIRDIPNIDGVYAVFAGDIIDMTGNGPRDLSYEQIFSNPKYGKDWAKKVMERISHKMLAIISGCHDNWEYSETGEYFGDELAKQTVTNIFVPDAILLNMKIGNQKYPVYIRHKLANGSNINISHAMFRMARELIDFEVGVEAHRHTPAISVQNIRDKVVTVINCGSYKKLDTYGHKKAFVQQQQNIPGFILDGNNHNIIPFFNWRDGIKLLEAMRNEHPRG
jgi:hypothetical protein